MIVHLLSSDTSRLAVIIVIVWTLSATQAAADESYALGTAEFHTPAPILGPVGGEPVVSPDLIGLVDLELKPPAQKDASPQGSRSVIVPTAEASGSRTTSPMQEVGSSSAEHPKESSPSEKTPATVAEATSTKATVTPVRPTWHKPLTSAEMRLRDRLRAVDRAYADWRPNTRDHSPWEILHLIVAHGTESQVLIDGPHGEPATAIGWLCFNRPFRNMELLNATPDGCRPRQGPGYEGHHGQFLGMLAQARVMQDYPIRVGGQELTVEDLVKYEQQTCYPRTELTFKLIGLNHYLEPTALWENDRGEKWSIERLVREELAQPIRGAACGGTHRLEGLSMAVKKRQRQGLPIDGPFAKAANVVRNFQQYTFRLQNRDGSFSTEWFRGRGTNPDPKRRMRTSGHQLEWLVISLPDQELRGPQLQRGVAYLTGLLWQGRHQEWDAGMLGHSINALRIYNARVFQRIEKYDAPGAVASKESASNTRQ